MVAANEDPSHLTRAGDHLIRIGPITDDLAEVPDHVACRKSRPAGIEGIDIRVNIANDEDAHEPGRGKGIVRRTRRSHVTPQKLPAALVPPSIPEQEGIQNSGFFY